VNINLIKYTIVKPEIIVLTSHKKSKWLNYFNAFKDEHSVDYNLVSTKLSAHVIYKNILFEDIYKMKIFMNELDSPLIKNNILDLNIYKEGCFRLLWNSKKGKNNILNFYRGINYNRATDKQLFYDCLLLNSNNGELITVNTPTAPPVKNTNIVTVKQSMPIYLLFKYIG